MTNHARHQRSGQKRRSEDQSHRARSCSGIGANAARGRKVWKRISARKERRSESGENLPPHNPNRKASTRPFVRPDFSDE